MNDGPDWTIMGHEIEEGDLNEHREPIYYKMHESLTLIVDSLLPNNLTRSYLIILLVNKRL